MVCARGDYQNNIEVLLALGSSYINESKHATALHWLKHHQNCGVLAPHV